MKRLLLILTLTIQAMAGSVGQDEQAFALDLYEQLDKKENLVFSPYSIFSNLSLVSFGAEGQTAEQIKKALRISAPDKRFLDTFYTFNQGLTRKNEGGYQFYAANALFADEKVQFRASFKEIGTRAFGAALQSVDFGQPEESLKAINQWVSKKTKGHISSLLDPQDVNAATRMIAANAVYFQGDWVYPFAKKTSKAPFSTSDGISMVKMMRQINRLAYFDQDEAYGIQLPFVRKGAEQPALDCVIVVPRKEVGSIDQDTLNKWLGAMTPTLVDAHVPKFCLKQKIDLNEPLQKLGIEDAFTTAANFENIALNQNLMLNKVLHETYFNFNKTGVTATAATTSQIGLKSLPPSEEEPTLFLANRPFYFFIIDTHTKAILFMGHVNNPKDKPCEL